MPWGHAAAMAAPAAGRAAPTGSCADDVAGSADSAGAPARTDLPSVSPPSALSPCGMPLVCTRRQGKGRRTSPRLPRAGPTQTLAPHLLLALPSTLWPLLEPHHSPDAAAVKQKLHTSNHRRPQPACYAGTPFPGGQDVQDGGRSSGDVTARGSGMHGGVCACTLRSMHLEHVVTGSRLAHGGS